MADKENVDLDACREVARTCPRNALRRVAQEVGRRFEEAYDGLGISGQQFSLMVSISLGPQPTIVSLAKVRRLDQTTITRNVQVLQNLGFARTVPSKEDGRVRVILLTAKGRRALSTSLDHWREARDDFERRVGRDRTELLMKLVHETLELLEVDPSEEDAES